MEPGRRSCKPRNSSKSLDLWVSKVARSFGIGVSSLCTVSNLYVYIRSEYCHKKRKLDRYHPHAAHPAGDGSSPPPRPRATITSWVSSSKIPISSAELLCFAEPECPSKRSSTIWRAEKHSKTFWRDFLPSRVNRLSPRSKKQNTSCLLVLKCAF